MIFLQTISKTELLRMALRLLTTYQIRSIAPILLNGHRKVYATILTIMFIAITLNLAINWHNLQQVVTVLMSNDDLNELLESLPADNVVLAVLFDATSWTRIAILFADIVLVCLLAINAVYNFIIAPLQVWRCHTLWAQSKTLLIVFIPFLFADSGKKRLLP